MPTKSTSYGGVGHYRRGRGRAVSSRSGADAYLLPSSRVNLNKAVVPPKSTPRKAVPKLKQPKKAPAPKKGPRSGKAKKCKKCTH